MNFKIKNIFLSISKINVKKKATRTLPEWQTRCGKIKSNLSNYYDTQFQVCIYVVQ